MQGVPDIIDRVCIGGWPALIDAHTQDAGSWLRDYRNQIVLVEIQGLGARRRDPENIADCSTHWLVTSAPSATPLQSSPTRYFVDPRSRSQCSTKHPPSY